MAETPTRDREELDRYKLLPRVEVPERYDHSLLRRARHSLQNQVNKVERTTPIVDGSACHRERDNNSTL